MIRYLLATLALASCAPVESQTQGVPVRRCDASGLGDLVGKPGTSQLGVEALRRSHSGTMRWIRPDTMVTRDFRVERLNIVMDKVNVVTKFTCG